VQRQFVVFWAIIGCDGGGSWQKWAARPGGRLALHLRYIKVV
jgi:hypothetical protein